MTDIEYLLEQKFLTNSIPSRTPSTSHKTYCVLHGRKIQHVVQTLAMESIKQYPEATLQLPYPRTGLREYPDRLVVCQLSQMRQHPNRLDVCQFLQVRREMKKKCSSPTHEQAKLWRYVVHVTHQHNTLAHMSLRHTA